MRILPVLLMIVSYSLPCLLVIHISIFKNAKISLGPPLRHFLYNYFSLTAMPPNFKAQKIHEERIPPILPMILCYSLPYLLVIWFTHYKISKFLVDIRYDHGYAVIFSSRACYPIFKVNQAPKRTYSPFL